MRRIVVSLGAGAALTMGGLAYSATAVSGGSAQPTTAPIVLTSAKTPASSVPNGAKAAHAKAHPSVHGHRGAFGLTRRVVHADLVVKAKGGAFKTVDIDRGTITAISSGSITLSRSDKVSVTEAIGSTTRFPGRSEAQLKVGDKVVVISSAGQATAVRTPGAHAKGPGHKAAGAKLPTTTAPSIPAPSSTAPSTIS